MERPPDGSKQEATHSPRKLRRMRHALSASAEFPSGSSPLSQPPPFPFHPAPRLRHLIAAIEPAHALPAAALEGATERGVGGLGAGAGAGVDGDGGEPA